jgi:pimeloyl-ACP methyl ester carboxylesterase
MAALATPVPRPFPPLEGVEHRYVEARGHRFHVAEAGGGEPLVMLHGWPQHWYEWRHQIPALAKHYRVICPDLRGFGWSDAPPSGYDKETLAEDMVGVMDALGLDRVKLVGHDWGGWCGFLICMNHPDRIERFLALNIPPPWGKTDLRTFAAIWRFWYQGLLATPLGRWVLENRPGFVGYIIRGTSPNNEAFSEEEVAAFTEPLREPARANATVQLYRTFLLREFPKIARGAYAGKRLATPTLLMFGTKDFAISPALLRGYEPFVEDFTLELVPDSGHFIAEEKPQLVTERALEFFGARPG